MPDIKISPAAFAVKIKDKYPQYKDIPDADLVKRIVDKYPDYKESIDFGQKKNSLPEQSTEQFAVSPSASVGGVPTSGNGLNPSPETSDFEQFNPEQGNPFVQPVKPSVYQNASAIGSKHVENPPEIKEGGIMNKVAQYLYLPALNKGFSDLVVKPLAGATDFIDNTTDKLYTNLTGEETPSWLRKSGAFDKAVGFFDKQYEKRDKPSNIVSEVGEGLVGTVPLLASLATGTGEANLLAKAPGLFGKLSQTLAATGGLNAYKDATDQGASYSGSLDKAAKGFVKGGLEGEALTAQMLVGGALGKGTANLLIEKGLLKGGKAAKAVLHALSIGTVFGGTSAGGDILNGQDINTHEAAKQFGMGLAFEAMPAAKAIHGEIKDRIEGGKINDNAAQQAAVASSAANLNAESAIRNIVQLPKETLLSIDANIKDGKDDLYANSIEAGAKAYDTKDIKEKRSFYANQLLFKTQGDVKMVVDKLRENKNEILSDIQNSEELPDADKTDLIDKLNSLSDQNNIVDEKVLNPETHTWEVPIENVSEIPKFTDNETKPQDGGTPEELRTGNAGTDGSEEASIGLRKSIKAAQAELPESERENSKALDNTEKRAALKYAKDNNIWIKDIYDLGNSTDVSGQENTVVINPEEHAVYKSNNLSNAKNSVSTLLEQVGFHNDLFPETKYDVVGVTGLDGNEKRSPHIEVVLKQHFVDDAVQATPGEISDYMQSRGFKKVDDSTFTDGEYIVSDLHPRNVLKGPKGAIHVIDDIIKKVDNGNNQIAENTTAAAPILPQPESPAEATNSSQAVDETIKPDLAEQESQYKDASIADLASRYNNEVTNPTHLSPIEVSIADFPFAITRESYSQFGDKNNITPSKAKSYFSKKGLSADVIAKEINDNSFNGEDRVSPQDVIDFMDRFPNGNDSVRIPSGNPTLKEINDTYFEKTGKKLNRKTAKLVLEAVIKVPDASVKLNEEMASIIESEGVTLDNIDSADVQNIIGFLKPNDLKIEDANKIIRDYLEKNGNNKSTTADSTTNISNEQSAGSDDQSGSIRSGGGESGDTADRGINNSGEVFAGRPNSQTGRVPVLPMDATPKKISDILLDVASGLKQNLFYTKVGRALGSYAPANSAIRIRYSGDLDTSAHEIGHGLDDKYKLYDQIINDPEALKEIEPFKKHGSNPPKGVVDKEKYRIGEGIAEWIRAFVVNPEEAKKVGPTVFEIYDKTVPADDKKSIEQFSEDIRTLAGASGRNAILSNVDFEPEKDGNILQKLFKKEASSNEFTVSWADRFAVNFLKPLRVFDKAFEYAKGIKGIDEVLPEKDPEILSRLLLGIDGKYGELLKSGMTDAKGEVLKDADGNPKNISWLLEPLDNSDVKSIENETKDVVSLMIAQRTLELAERFGREKGLSGIGAGIKSDVEVAENTIKEFAEGDPDKLKRIEEAASRYREFSDDILRYMVDKGRLSEESYDNIKKDNDQYVSMQRIVELGPDQELESTFGGKGALGSASEVVKKIKGSSKQIQNPYISLMDTMYKAVKESDRNEVLQAFTAMITEKRGMYQGDVNRLSDIGIRGKDGDKNTTTVFNNGKAEKWIFQPDINNAIKNLDSDGFKLPGLITAPAKILRAMTTNFPVFALRNWVRDFQDRLIKSNENTGISGIKNLFGDKEHWKELARRGGLNAGYYYRDRVHYYGLLRENMKDLAKDKNFTLLDRDNLKAIATKYHDIMSLSESSNRVAEYRSAFNKAKAEGMDNYNASLKAAYKSRDLIDFAVVGHYMKIVNQIIPFSNAAVQGLRSTVSLASENPAGFVARMALVSIIPQAAMWFWNHRDEKTAKEYENQPAYVRDLYWLFKMGDNKWGAIPKPYELSVAGAGTDRLMSKYLAGNDKAFEGYAGTIAKTLMPFDDSNLGGPFQSLIEGESNYDFFRDKHIVPPNEDALDLSLRHTKTASVLGQKLQAIAGIDARKIDHFIQGQFSYFGKTAQDISNIGSDNNKFGFDLTDTGLIKNSPAYNSQAVQDFLEYATRYQLNQTRPYKQFSKLTREYFDETDEKKKEELGLQLIDLANKKLEIWKEQDLADKKIEKFEAKNK